MTRLEGKVAVVLGGTGGFGQAVVRRFANEGAIVIVASRRGDVAAEHAAEVGGTGVACDITDLGQLETLAEQIVADHGRIDIAANFTGSAATMPISHITPESLEPLVEVNFNGSVYFIRAMGNAMAAGAGGSIILASSIIACRPTWGAAAYGGAKKALEFVTEIAALEFGPHQVRVNAIAAHVIETEMTRSMFENPVVIEAVVQQTPLGHLGEVDDVANCALFLASDESRYISGETIRVDGAAGTQKLPSPQDIWLVGQARPDLLEGPS